MGKTVSIANLSIAVGNWQRRTLTTNAAIAVWPEGWVPHSQVEPHHVRVEKVITSWTANYK